MSAALISVDPMFNNLAVSDALNGDSSFNELSLKSQRLGFSSAGAKPELDGDFLGDRNEQLHESPTESRLS